MNKLPTCTVIVLNYNGKRLITKVLDRLNNLNYPIDRYDIVIVDNKSTDGSQKIISNYISKHSNVKLIESDRNGGFAAGNNLAITQSRSNYIALLNNDCLVDKDWLLQLVNIAEECEDSFAVNSKIILYPKHLYLETSYSELIEPEIVSSSLLNFQNNTSIPLKTTNIKEKYILDVACSPDDPEIVINFKLNPTLSDIPKFINFNVYGSNQIIRANLIDSLTYNLTITSKFLRKYSSDLIQNCGSMIFQDGYGRDIGACVVPGIQNYEIDKGQYDQASEVFACCGASCLYRKSILDEIGYLDENFFMYYEDTEISWRAKIYGYKNYYAPKSIVRHFHSLTSGEGSNFFIYQAEYGRLLSLFYSAPSSVFYGEFLKMLLRAISRNIKSVVSKMQFETIYLRVIWNFIKRISKYSKSKKNKYLNLPDYSSKALILYNEILSGKWYLQ